MYLRQPRDRQISPSPRHTRAGSEAGAYCSNPGRAAMTGSTSIASLPEPTDRGTWDVSGGRRDHMVVFGVLGFWVFVFWVLGFWVFVFWVLGFWVFGFLGFGVFGFLGDHDDGDDNDDGDRTRCCCLYL